MKSYLSPSKEDLQQIIKLSKENGFNIHQLGTVESDIIYLIESEKKDGCLNLLVTAGFHGDEPSGIFGIICFLKMFDHKLLLDVNLSILPVVNYSGFRQGSHCNKWNENPNRGFCHPNLGASPSREGIILLKNIELLIEKAEDGLLCLHEDIDQEYSYLYTYEKSNEPGPFSFMFRDTQARHFPQLPDNDDPDLGNIKDGIIFNHCDGSFEDRLFHEGVPRIACIETPGKYRLREREIATVMMINTFILMRGIANG